MERLPRNSLTPHSTDLDYSKLENRLLSSLPKTYSRNCMFYSQLELIKTQEYNHSPTYILNKNRRTHANLRSPRMWNADHLVNEWIQTLKYENTCSDPKDCRENIYMSHLESMQRANPRASISSNLSLSIIKDLLNISLKQGKDKIPYSPRRLQKFNEPLHT